MIETYKLISKPDNNISMPEDFININILETQISPFTKSVIIFGKYDNGSLVTAKFSNLPEGSKNEWQGLLTTHKSGISVPEPVALVKNQADTMGVISEFIDGKDLINSQDLSDYSKFGRIIREMHLKVKVDGLEWMKFGKHTYEYYDKYLIHCGELIKEGIIDSTRVYDLMRFFASSLEERLGKVDPVFTHYDLHDQQIIKNCLGKLYLIDLERWREGDPLDDLSIYLFHNLRMNRPYDFFVEFIRGYLNDSNLTDTEKSVINFFLLFTGFKSVDYYRRFRKNDLPYAIAQLKKIEQFAFEEKLVKSL
jgi:thiamine kinase-like enzyme